MKEEIARLRRAITILRMGLNGRIDSDDANDLALTLECGIPIDWSRYAPTTEEIARPVVEA